MEANDRLISYRHLNDWGIAALKALNVPARDAAIVSGGLVQTSLWRIDSHGVARLPHYLTRVGNRTINARPRFTFKKTGAGRIHLFNSNNNFNKLLVSGGIVSVESGARLGAAPATADAAQLLQHSRPDAAGAQRVAAA